MPRFEGQRFCSRYCGSRHTNRHREPTPPRQPLDVLVEGVTSIGYEAVGREYGVSGNAVRKWIRSYGVEPPPGGGRTGAGPPPAPRSLDDAAARRALELLAQGVSALQVAREVGTGRHAIDDLKHGRTYRELPRPEGLPRAA